MDITFRLPGPWGPGKGANLAPSEVDNNFWSIAQAIIDLQNNPSQPVGIASISVSGTQMTITLTDGTVMGPFTLPVLTFRWRGEWQPATPYAQLDVFTLASVGIFMVLIGHTSADTFDPAYQIDGLAAYLQLFGAADASLDGLPDVTITDPADRDIIEYVADTGQWVNFHPGSMLYQDATNVFITGGNITGIGAPTLPGDVATKAYVDALPAGMTAPDKTMMSNIGGAVAPAIPHTLTEFLDAVLGSPVRGTLLYRGAAGWAALAPGTNGLFLKTSGAGADPVWSVGGSGVTSVAAGAGITTGAGPITATGSVALAAIADNSVLANISGTTVAPSATTLSAILDRVMSSTRGSVLVRAGGGWVALAPGTAGYFLQTQGGTADPQWASPAGAGTVTSVSAGTGISTGGAPITGAGTVSLAAIANLSVLANISGGSAAPVPATATALFDALFGATQGAVLYRSASAWAMLSPGTAGQVLTTGGAAANPAWANAAAGAPIANLLLLANISGATAAASGNTLSNILDAVISSSRGTLLYRGASGWVGLPPGTAGQLLSTGGTAGNPSWVTGATGGGASITTSDTPPASPADGDAWWDSVGGQLYIRYDDGNSQQWVPATNSQGPAGATGATGPTGPTGATGPTGPAGSANMSLMTAGQIPIAANATSVTSSANLSGDVTSAPTTLVTTLATVNANIGTFQGITVNGKGLVTAASNQGYLTAASAASTYVPMAGGVTMTGALTVTGSLTASGASAGMVILDRGTPANYWQEYSTGNNWHLDNNTGTRLTMQSDGVLRSGHILPFVDNTHLSGGSGLNWVSVGSYAFANASDAALKTNIESAPATLTDVLTLDPKTFTWIEGADTERTHWGFLAQDVAAVFGNDFGGFIDGAEGEKAIAYHELTAVLWRAVQELAARVEALEARAAP